MFANRYVRKKAIEGYVRATIIDDSIPLEQKVSDIINVKKTMKKLIRMTRKATSEDEIIELLRSKNIR